MSTILTARPLTRFTSPEDRTATEPPELRGLRRDGVRLLVATPAGIRHTVFCRLGDQLRAGDVLLVNTSATLPGQLDGTRDGSTVVVHVANRLSDGTRVVELRTAPDASAPVLDGRVGERIGLPLGGVVRLLAPYPESGSHRAVSGIGSGVARSPSLRTFLTTCGSRHGRSATATSAARSRSRPTRRSSRSARAARKCRAQAGRSVTSWLRDLWDMA